VTRSGAVAVLGVLAAAVLAAPARAQTAAGDERPAVLLVMDSSKSMSEPAGNGGTRLDAAKAAVEEVLKAVPAEAPLGLRVYGSQLSGVSRAQGCTDTRLVAPVKAGNRAAISAAIQGLEGKGRTPIGRSLLATPGDFGPTDRRKQVILVSDGGDNCAPPDPCRAARRIARAGLELNVSVVGLQVNPRVRRQLRCIARAGGGTYVDAQDPDRLREELLAAFARAFRAYQPRGTELQGAAQPDAAPQVGNGLYQGEIAPGETQYAAVEAKRGERLFVASTLLVPVGVKGSGAFALDLVDPGGDTTEADGTAISGGNDVNGVNETLAFATDPAGFGSDFEPGVYRIRTRVNDNSLQVSKLRYELAVQALGPDERPGLVRTPGPAPRPVATATPSAAPGTERSDGAGADDGSDAPVLAGVAVGGLALGLAASALLRRRRRE
jgi:Ca-activated chloride channel family protein